jgi:hypothetical protein
MDDDQRRYNLFRELLSSRLDDLPVESVLLEPAALREAERLVSPFARRRQSEATHRARLPETWDSPIARSRHASERAANAPWPNRVPSAIAARSNSTS